MKIEVNTHEKNMIRFAAEHPEVLVMSADLGSSCEVKKFRQTYPDRYLTMGIFSTRANRRSESHEQGFKLWWTDSAEGKLQTNMCSIREIDLIGVFLFADSMTVERVIG